MWAYRTLSIALVVGGVIAAQTAAVAQENRGTPEQQQACTPDVFRLCGAYIPDPGRITACLRQNTPLLSDPCRAVFEPVASVPQPVPPRARNVKPKPYDIRPKIYDEDEQ